MNLKTMRANLIKEAQDLIAKGDQLSAEDLARVEAIDVEVKELTEKIDRAAKGIEVFDRLKALGADIADESGDDEKKAGSLGERFVKSAGFKAFRESHPTGIGSGTPIRIEAKGLGGVSELGIGRKATITTETGQFPAYGRESGYRSELPADDPLTFLDLVTTGPSDVAYSEYARIIAETDNAAVVPEGELKPESDVTTDKAESKAYTYADGFSITNQTLADDGALAAYMESRVRRHVRGVVEQKLFNGSGAGVEPEGIMNTTGTLSQAFSEDVIVTLARALETFEASNGDADPQAIVMNPSDIWDLRLLKDADGRYMFGDPLSQGPIPTPWGVPIVKGRKLEKGTALVGRFDSVHFLELEALNVLAFNQHKDYAQRGMVYVRAEMRGRQLFYAPREVVVASIAAAGA